MITQRHSIGTRSVGVVVAGLSIGTAIYYAWNYGNKDSSKYNPDKTKFGLMVSAMGAILGLIIMNQADHNEMQHQIDQLVEKAVLQGKVKIEG